MDIKPPSDEEYDQFLSEISEIAFRMQEEELKKQKVESLAGEIAEYLRSEGVDLSGPITGFRIRTIAAQKIIVDEKLLLNPNDSEYLNKKKQLQAKYKLNNLDPAWIELIDRLFPGDPLSEDDAETMAEVFSASMSESESINMEQDSVRQAIIVFLQNFGYIELNEDEKIAVEMLVGYYLATQMSRIEKLKGARTCLLEHNITDEVWQNLIAQLYRTKM